MEWMIPGTVIPVSERDQAHIEHKLRDLFLGGGVMLGQVAAITGLEPYTVQNWVKRGFLSKPEQKRYSLRQLCRILIINMLKSALAMEEIVGLLQYINGTLDDESDDLIDDTALYFLFIRAAVGHRSMQNDQGRDAYLQQLLGDYQEPVPGARQRVETVLKIMLTAWAASLLRQSSQQMVRQLRENQ